MSTLILTCIYSNLYGSEFGGRSSRKIHYRYSLLNILNMNPTKVVCFTSHEELEDLKNFFYSDNSIDPNLLEFKAFNLKNTKYAELIKKIKNIEEQKRNDRCFEIQYNKFCWIENIENITSYDYIYWFDAGLSHSGLFPNEYIYNTLDNNHNRKLYNIKLFTPEYLNYIKELTKDGKLLLISKNNKITSSEKNIPEKYYTVFNNDRHIIGGFFGGLTNNYIDISIKFQKLLLKLLNDEKILYFEEHIMSCLYANEKNIYSTLEFDDWIYWPDHANKPLMKYFYQIFLTSDTNNK